jgi:hypothetical protein
MMNRIFFIFLFVGICLSISAQNYSKQKTRFVLTNIGVNGLAGGIGAVINKKPNEKFGKVLLKGFGQGCLGGGFNVLGKEITYQIKVKENLGYAWPARITNAIGSSITQNAAANIDFWERWHFNLGPVRLEYRIPEKKFQARVFASAIYGTTFMAVNGKLNLAKSLKTGVMFFEREDDFTLYGDKAPGIMVAPAIGITKSYSGNYHYLVAHEIMHILQFDQIVWLNSFANKPDLKLKTDFKFYNKVSKYLYFDLNGLSMLGLYMTQINQPWECRYFEREADIFSNRNVYPKCK